MSSLYGRLFQYQANDKQTPRENYLTEALCDLLNRIGEDAPAEQRTFLKNLELFKADGAAERLYFKTQEHITTESGSRKPDLIGYDSNDDPVLVIEVKIDAQFTENQLWEYGTWLDKHGREGAVLALLTDSTLPPSDFRGRVVYWRDVRRELKSLPGHGNFVYLTLAEEFIDFLHEQGIAVEMPKQVDFAKLGEYLKDGTAVRWQNFMNCTRERLKGVSEEEERLSWETDVRRQAGGSFQDDAHALTGWVNTRIPKISYISWGLYFVPEDGADPYGLHECYEIPRVHGAFLNAMYEKKEQMSQVHTEEPNAWYPLRAGKSGYARAVAFKALDAFCGDAEKLAAWFEDKFKKALEYAKANMKADM